MSKKILLSKINTISIILFGKSFGKNEIIIPTTCLDAKCINCKIRFLKNMCHLIILTMDNNL